jgi:hypothetical protein
VLLPGDSVRSNGGSGNGGGGGARSDEGGGGRLGGDGGGGTAARTSAAGAAISTSSTKHTGTDIEMQSVACAHGVAGGGHIGPHKGLQGEMQPVACSTPQPSQAALRPSSVSPESPPPLPHAAEQAAQMALSGSCPPPASMIASAHQSTEAREKASREQVEQELNEHTLHWPIEPSRWGIDPQLASLLNGLLERDPEVRLGSQDDGDSLRGHSIFEGMEWGLLRDGRLPAPFVPDPTLVYAKNFVPALSEEDPAALNDATTPQATRADGAQVQAPPQEGGGGMAVAE